jgi:hypothetical protein
MDLDDIYFARVRLLVIMAKAYLEDCQLGDQRRLAILENARHVEMESIDLGSTPQAAMSRNDEGNENTYDHLFFQRAKLLAVMMKAVAKGFPIGEHRKNAMQENLDKLCSALSFDPREEIPFLRVA